jgi:uncharacterized protein (TIGR01777 family)
MTVVIAGGTGFLGRPLAAALLEEGHQVVVLSRTAAAHVPPGARAVAWRPDGGRSSWAGAIDGADAVINLEGETIAGRRWSAARKERIAASRIAATHALVEAIGSAATPPRVLVSGSGVGFYGPRGDEIVTEDASAGDDFLARLCQRWESEAMRAASPHTRVVCLRTGLALAGDGGALAPMLLPFRLGVGGPLGSGSQYWPWIHRRDWVDLVRFALREDALAGPVNATAPNPVTNREFSRELGRVLRRPAILRAPAFAIRLALGEMADAVLTGQRAVPAKAERCGFRFTYVTLREALAAIFSR